MAKPKWTRDTPIAVFRAPWYNNWPAAFTLALTLTILVPVPALLNGRTIFGAVWLGLQSGVAVGIGAFLVFSALTFLYPVRLHREGIRGFEERGVSVVARWPEIGEAATDYSYGVPFYRFTVTGRSRDLWLPKAVVHQPDFVRHIQRLAPPDHSLFRLLAPAQAAPAPPSTPPARPRPAPAAERVASGRPRAASRPRPAEAAGRSVLAYVCGASVMATAAVALLLFGESKGRRG